MSFEDVVLGAVLPLLESAAKHGKPIPLRPSECRAIVAALEEWKGLREELLRLPLRTWFRHGERDLVTVKGSGNVVVVAPRVHAILLAARKAEEVSGGMGELSPEVVAELKRELAQSDKDRAWCVVIRLDRFRAALAALERIPELEERLAEANRLIEEGERVADALSANLHAEAGRAERLGAALRRLVTAGSAAAVGSASEEFDAAWEAADRVLATIDVDLALAEAPGAGA